MFFSLIIFLKLSMCHLDSFRVLNDNFFLVLQLKDNFSKIAFVFILLEEIFSIINHEKVEGSFTKW